jgi:hypothetical protein
LLFFAAPDFRFVKVWRALREIASAFLCDFAVKAFDFDLPPCIFHYHGSQHVRK